MFIFLPVTRWYYIMKNVTMKCGFQFSSHQLMDHSISQQLQFEYINKLKYVLNQKGNILCFLLLVRLELQEIYLKHIHGKTYIYCFMKIYICHIYPHMFIYVFIYILYLHIFICIFIFIYLFLYICVYIIHIYLYILKSHIHEQMDG